MPIPDSRLEGHRALHERTIGALQVCQESISVEFKSSAPWEVLKFKITKNVLAMGNLRDGGILVIGVNQNAGRWELTGITQEHLETFEPDDILAFVKRYVDTEFTLDIVRVVSDGTQFLALHTREFATTPLICTRNGPDGNNEGLVSGGFYVRLPNPPRTTRVMDAMQMQDLLELAAEKRARKLLEQIRRVGVAEENAIRQLDDELGGL